MIDELFIKYGSDKSSKYHNYSPTYKKILSPYKNYPLSLFIIGIGGYHHIDRGGGDIKAFYDYLPESYIDAIDIYPKSFLDNERIKTHICDQSSENVIFLVKNELQMGIPHIIIDDGSHINSHVIKSFELLFPLLRKGGYYIIEDCHTSYWDEVAVDGVDFGGGSHEDTTMNYFKDMTDALNNQHSKGRMYLRKEHLKNIDEIESIEFLREMIIIRK